MLQNFGDAIKGWIAGVVIFLISASFLLFGVEYYFQSGPNKTQVIARVNGDKITQAQLDQIAKQMQRFPDYQALPKAMQQSAALNELIKNKVWYQASRAAGLSVSDKMIGDWVATNPLFQYQGQFSQQRLNQLLYNNNMTMSRFVQAMRSDLQRQQLEDVFFNTSFILPSQSRHAQQINNQRRDIRYIRLTPQVVAQHIATPSAGAIGAYYESHTDELMSPERVKLSYLRVTPAQVRHNIQISDQKVRDFYRANLDSFKKPKRWVVLLVRVPQLNSGDRQAPQSLRMLSKALTDGQDFKKAAAHQGLSAKEETLNALTIDSATANVLQQMKLGQVSVPYQTKSAWQMFLLQSIKPAEQQTFDTVKEKIRRNLYNDAINSALSSQVDRLSNLSYTNPDSLLPAAKALGLVVKQSPWLTRQGKSQSFWADQHILKAAFGDDVLKNGNNSNVINLSDGSIIVFRVASHQLSNKKPLSQVRKLIVERIKKEQSLEQLRLLSNQLLSKFNAGQLKQSFLDSNGLVWVSVNGLSLSGDQKVPQSVRWAVFTTRQRQSKAAFIVPVMPGEQYLVQLIRVVNPPIKSKASADKIRAGNNLQVSNRAQLLSLMLQRHLVESATIKR